MPLATRYHAHQPAQVFHICVNRVWDEEGCGQCAHHLSYDCSPSAENSIAAVVLFVVRCILVPGLLLWIYVLCNKCICYRYCFFTDWLLYIRMCCVCAYTAPFSLTQLAEITMVNRRTFLPHSRQV